MVFIRVKHISGKKYAYLVENVKTDKGSRQKVKQYLGKIHEIESERLESDVSAQSRRAFIEKLVHREVPMLGKSKILFDSKKMTIQRKTKSKTHKEAVVRVNDGYICSFTLQRIMNFRKSNDIEKDGYTLGSNFLKAGLLITPEEFVAYFEL